MAQPGFIFGGNTGISYDELQQRRKVLDAMLMRSSAPQNVGEGIYALAEGITGGLENRRLRSAENEGRKTATDAFSQGMSSIGSPGSYAAALFSSPTIDPVAGAANMPSTSSPAGGSRAAAETRSAAGEDYVMNYLIGKGLSPAQAAGFTGNLIQESSLNTGARNRGDGRDGSDSIGIAQWNGDRARNLQSFAQGTGRDATNIDTQLDFALHEMGIGNQEWSKLPGWGAEGAAGRALRGAQDVAGAAAAGISYERPAGWSTANPTGGHGWDNRYGHANRLAGAGYGAQQQAAPVQVASNDPTAGVAAATAPQTPVQTVAAAMPQQQAQAPSEPVQRVAQAMPQMPAMPNNQIPPEALAALQNPYLSDGQRQALQIAIQQRQQGNAALYERQMAIYEQQMKAAQLQEQRGYDASVLADQRRYDAGLTDAKNVREDRRNQTLDAREDRDFAFRVEQGNKPPTSIQEYEYARAQGFQGTLADWEQANRKASAGSTTITMGEGDKFYENLDRKNAERFATLSDGGQNARGRQAQVDQLDALLRQSPSGAEAAIKTWLGDFGIATDDLGPLQASVALIEKLVPEQREPGSGPLSDADIAGFRRSLPRAINQPGGNQLIIGRLKAINEYDIARGEIADMVADRAITPAEGRKQLRELKNPLEGYTELVRSLGADGGRGGTPVADTTPREGGVPVGASMGDQPAAAQIKSKADFDALPSGALYTAPDGSTRKKR